MRILKPKLNSKLRKNARKVLNYASICHTFRPSAKMNRIHNTIKLAWGEYRTNTRIHKWGTIAICPGAIARPYRRGSCSARVETKGHPATNVSNGSAHTYAKMKCRGWPDRPERTRIPNEKKGILKELDFFCAAANFSVLLPWSLLRIRFKCTRSVEWKPVF